MLHPKYTPIILALALCCSETLPEQDAAPIDAAPPGGYGAECTSVEECTVPACLLKWGDDEPYADPGMCTSFCFPEDPVNIECPAGLDLACIRYTPTGESWCFTRCDTSAECNDSSACFTVDSLSRVCIAKEFLDSEGWEYAAPLLSTWVSDRP